jgi:hypothetical protein
MRDPELSSIGDALMRAVRALEDGADWQLAHSDAQPQDCAAGAVPFLRLAGTVIGGWLSARMAEAATAQLAADSSDAGFLRAKRITASHYATHILVEAPRCATSWSMARPARWHCRTTSSEI